MSVSPHTIRVIRIAYGTAPMCLGASYNEPAWRAKQHKAVFKNRGKGKK